MFAATAIKNRLIDAYVLMVQENVVGVKYGAWGRDRYGVKPVKVDALEVRPHPPKISSGPVKGASLYSTFWSSPGLLSLTVGIETYPYWCSSVNSACALAASCGLLCCVGRLPEDPCDTVFHIAGNCLGLSVRATAAQKAHCILSV